MVDFCFFVGTHSECLGLNRQNFGVLNHLVYLSLLKDPSPSLFHFDTGHMEAQGVLTSDTRMSMKH